MSASILSQHAEPCQVYQFPIKSIAVKAPVKSHRLRVSELTFYPRLNTWKAANVSLNPHTLEARSYDWWIFCKRINGQLVFNDYRYSNTTSKHQHKVRGWLRHQGYEFTSIEAPRGLQDLRSATNYYRDQIKKLEAEIAKPRSQARKNSERNEQIGNYLKKIDMVEQLIGAGGAA